MSELTDVTLAILAGGSGRRLGGAPKGLLRVGGRSAIEWLLDLRPLFADVVLAASCAEPYQTLGLRTVPDPVEGRGALAGLCAGLAGSRTPWVLAAACDMPFLSSEVVRLLARRRAPPAQLVVLSRGESFDPFPALYATKLLPRLQAGLDGRESVRRLLAQVQRTSVGEAELASVDPERRAQVNLNTPSDLARWGVQLPD
jgi:molybdenum cofactor guanylyltransferase